MEERNDIGAAGPRGTYGAGGSTGFGRGEAEAAGQLLNLVA